MGFAPKNFNAFSKVKQQKRRIIRRRRYDRNRDPKVKNLYGRVRWRNLRNVALKRDGYLCQTCLHEHERERLATVVDHITPHKGDLKLFYSLINLRCQCKRCHDGKTAASDGGFGNPIRP